MKTIKNIALWITLAVAIAFLTLGYASGQKVSAVAETSPIKWNMSLGEDISVKFTVDKSVGANACLKVSFDGKDEKTLADYTETDGGYMYVYTGLAPQDMAKDITVKLYASVDSDVVLQEFTSSLSGYLKSLLDGAANGGEKLSADTPLAKLIVSLLNYGAAAQDYVGDTAIKCNEFLSGDGYTGYSAFVFTESLAVPFKATATQNTANVQPTEAYMYLAYNAEMRFDFTVGEVMPDGATVTVGGQEKQAILTNVSGNNFTLSVPLASTEVSKEVSATPTKGGEKIGYTVTGTAAGYIGGQIADEKDGAIVKALYAYAKSAELYSSSYTQLYTVKDAKTLESGVTITGGANIGTSKPNAEKRFCIGNLDTGKGRTIEYSVISEGEKQNVALYAEFGELQKANNFADWCDLTVNGTPITENAKMPYGENYIASNEQTFLGYITLKNGVNEIKFTVNSSKQFTSHNFYGILLGTTGIAANIEDYSAERILYSTEKGQAKLASYVSVTGGTRAVGYPAHRVNAAGYYPIGNVDNNVGLTITFKITASEECYVKLSAEFCYKDKSVKFSEWCKVSVNGGDIGGITATMPTDSKKVWVPSNTFTELCKIKLAKGENTITFTVTTTTGYNLYGIKLAHASSVSVDGVAA